MEKLAGRVTASDTQRLAERDTRLGTHRPSLRRRTAPPGDDPRGHKAASHDDAVWFRRRPASDVDRPPLRLRSPNTHITSGGLGTMGFSLPAAMGVKFGLPDKEVWAVAGDGGIQMNIQELATIANEGLEIKVVIMNNGYLGMVRQWQKFFHGGRYSSTPITSPNYLLWPRRTASKRAKSTRLTSWRRPRMGGRNARMRHRRCRHRAGAERVPMIPSGQSVAAMIEEPGVWMTEATLAIPYTSASAPSIVFSVSSPPRLSRRTESRSNARKPGHRQDDRSGHQSRNRGPESRNISANCPTLSR